MRVAAIGRHRGAVNDGAAVLLLHVRYGEPGQIELGEEVVLERPLDLLGRDLEEIAFRVLLARVVDQDVEAAEPLDHPVDERAADPVDGEVAAERQEIRLLRAHEPLGLRRVVVLFEIGYGDLRTLFGKADSHGAADAAVAAGHDRRSALKLAGTPIIARLVLGRRTHLRFAALLVILVLGRQGLDGHGTRLLADVNGPRGATIASP